MRVVLVVREGQGRLMDSRLRGNDGSGEDVLGWGLPRRANNIQQSGSVIAVDTEPCHQANNYLMSP
jgi:hypothetical protein